MSEPAVGAVPERARLSEVAAESARRWWILGVAGLVLPSCTLAPATDSTARPATVSREEMIVP